MRTSVKVRIALDVVVKTQWRQQLETEFAAVRIRCGVERPQIAAEEILVAK